MVCRGMGMDGIIENGSESGSVLIVCSQIFFRLQAFDKDNADVV